MIKSIKFATLALAIIASSGAIAGQLESCKTIANAAEGIMDGRQNGTSAAEVYDRIEKGVKDKPAKNTLMLMVKEAYKTPKFSTNEYKNNAVSEFKNEYMIACMAGE